MRNSSQVNHAVSFCVSRWRTDLRELFENILRDPLARKRGRVWAGDFSGEIGPRDIHYAVFLAVLSIVPAAIVAYTSTQPRLVMFANFFRAPLQVAVSGFLTAVFIFAGTHFNKQPGPFSVAFKLMLRVMAVHPLLAFMLLLPLGEPFSLLVYGLFVIRGVRKTYPIPVEKVAMFYGAIYFVFFILQLNATLYPAHIG
ncbi:MAG: hypothetical protein HY075_12330 [Deltaproteobacteria bacterium]|nr:hypothetical protein [Deltaproteobacteria bacterium]